MHSFVVVLTMLEVLTSTYGWFMNCTLKFKVAMSKFAIIVFLTSRVCL